MKTVSAPAGIGAPVKMRTASPGAQGVRRGTAGGHALDHREAGLVLGVEIGVAHGVAVDRGIVERRQIDRRDDVARDHAPVRGLERNGFDLRDRRNPLADDALDLVDRKQRAGEREAVVGELRHHRLSACARTAASGAACRIRMSAMRSMSSRSTTGTRAAGSGASEAMATIAGSSGCRSGLPTRGAIDFELGMRLALVAFDQHEIDRAELLEQCGERGLGFAAQLMHERPTLGRADQHLGRAGHAMGVRILARLVDVEAVMGVLERRYLEPARDDAGDHFGEERGLAGAAPAGEADDAHAAL